MAVPIDYLVIGGGGAGGDNGAGLGGGGGAGGLLQGTDALATGSYGVVIGAGGAGSGNNGVASTWNAHSATGGGAGALVTGPGATGGNGGGGEGLAGAGGVGTINYNGGGGTGNAGGGGGGAGGVGGSTVSIGHAAPGGPGLASLISGVSVTYAGGGGGNGNLSPGAGGVGGGGNGGAGGAPGTPGTPNTGGGGGGGGYGGGSGVVIVRYQTTLGTGTGGAITTSGGGAYTIHTFTANGTFGFTEAASGGGGGGGGTPSAIAVPLGLRSALALQPLPEIATDRVPDGSTRGACDQFNADNAGYLTDLATALDNLGSANRFAPIWNAGGAAPNFGNAQFAAAFTQIGGLVYFVISIVFGSTTNFGSGLYSFGLPIQALGPVDNMPNVANSLVLGTATMLDASAGQQVQGALVTGAFDSYVSFRVLPYNNTHNGIESTYPFTWASGDYLLMQGWYFALLAN